MSKAYDVTWAAMERLVEIGKTKMIGQYRETSVRTSSTHVAQESPISRVQSSGDSCQRPKYIR